MRFTKVAGLVLMAGLAHAKLSEVGRSEAEVGTTNNDKFEALGLVDKIIANDDLSDPDTQIKLDQLSTFITQSTLDNPVAAQPATNKKISTSLQDTQFLPTLFCTGKDTKKKNIAGVCMDGNFLWYTSADCSNKCRCDEAGEVHCDIPDDCGPQKDVVEFCSGNEGFTCSCLMRSGEKGVVERRDEQVARVLGAGVEAVYEDNDLAPAEILDAIPVENAHVDSNLVQTQKENVHGEPGQQKQEGTVDAGPQQAQDAGIPMINPCWLETTCAGRTTRHFGDTFIARPTTMATVTTPAKLVS